MDERDLLRVWNRILEKKYLYQFSVGRPATVHIIVAANSKKEALSLVRNEVERHRQSKAEFDPLGVFNWDYLRTQSYGPEFPGTLPMLVDLGFDKEVFVSAGMFISGNEISEEHIVRECPTKKL